MRRLINTVSVITILAALTLTASCRRDENPALDGKRCDMTFHAVIEGSPTKTTLDGSDSDATRKILWTPNDSIGITTASTINKLVYTGSDNLEQVDFTGSVTLGDTYYGIYPYSSAVSFSSETFTLTLPATQQYVEDNFSGDIFPMVAYSSTQSLPFKNLCGALRLRLKGSETISSIIFQGKASDGSLMKVAGEATVAMNYDEVPSIVMSENGTTSVTLDCGSGVALDPTTAKTFIIVLPPETYNTFSLTITTTDGKLMIKNALSPLTIARATGKLTGDLEFAEAPEIDLSASGTANCYIVPSLGRYTFNAKVIGNGPAGLLPDISQDLKNFHTTSTDISPLSAQILWQDVENLIYNVRIDSDGILHFSSSAQKGNALIAVYDNVDPNADGANIIWSWHIWCTDTPSDENYLNWVDRAFTVMDRNLGAIAARPGDNVEATYGVHYQWGRKDPMSRNASFITLAGTSSDNGTIANTIAHPNVCYYAEGSSSYDWHYASRNNYLWGNPTGYQSTYTATKTIYDPCPIGYMVPHKEPWVIFSTTGNNTTTPAEFNVSGSFSNGWNFYNSAAFSGSTSWYPAAGYRTYNSSQLGFVGNEGRFWSSAPANSSADDGLALTFTSSGVNPINNGDNDRAPAYSVRCVRAESYTPITSVPTVASSDATSLTITTASITGEVTSLGGLLVTERGIVYSTSEDPTTSTGTKVISEITVGTNGKGSYTVDLTNLIPGDTYYYKAYAINAAGTGYSEEKSFTTTGYTNITDLSASGTANCYIVSAEGSYSINTTVIGNGPAGLLPDIDQNTKKFHTTTTDITPLSAKLLWQDVDGLISTVSLNSEGQLRFIASSSKGNALIAVYDNANPDAENATILWSWHIWCTDTPTDNHYKNWLDREFNVMDRNIGATASLPGDNVEATYGLYYQWGRKDPFTDGRELYGPVDITTCVTDETKGNISNVINNPTVFYYTPNGQFSVYDWQYPDRSTYLWGVGYYDKTIYDPCPVGYSVPTLDLWNNFTIGSAHVAYIENRELINSQGDFNNGWFFYSQEELSGPTVWYPTAGHIFVYSGNFYSGDCYYWSRKAVSDGVVYLQIYGNGGVISDSGVNGRASGGSIRCIKDNYSFSVSAPTVASSDATSIISSSASAACEVTNLGGAQVTERGIVYSTASNPITETGTKATSQIATGTNGKGSYSVNLTTLAAGTTYYYRAYAINAAGTGYSEQKSFTTPPSGSSDDNFNFDGDEYQW